MKRPLAAVLILLASAAGAGCLGSLETPDPGEGSATKPRSTKPASLPPREAASSSGGGEDPNVTAGKRWHFHNYWGTTPNLTVFEGWVHFRYEPQAGCCPPRGSFGVAEFRPAQGSIIPSETGRIDVLVTWNETAPYTSLNLSYRPANSGEFVAAGPVEQGVNATIRVSEDMTDPPHAGSSAWAFRLAPSGPEPLGVGVGGDAVHVTVVASIGRPIFIDPPHVDRWNGATTLPLVAWAHEFAGAAKLPGGGHLVTGPGPDVETRSERLATVAVLNGSQVPEGARTVLARLTWESGTEGAPWSLGLAYREGNAGTEGAPEPSGAGPTMREYRIPVLPRMTDNPYTNQTTWSFEVLLEGDASAFRGAVRLDVWVSREAPDAAAFPDG